MDHGKTGIISMAEIREIIKKQDEKMSHSELKHLVDELDHYGNGQINYI
jgi:Ca2+-binding EF-hand superfamily protein